MHQSAYLKYQENLTNFLWIEKLFGDTEQTKTLKIYQISGDYSRLNVAGQNFLNLDFYESE